MFISRFILVSSVEIFYHGFENFQGHCNELPDSAMELTGFAIGIAITIQCVEGAVIRNFSVFKVQVIADFI